MTEALWHVQAGVVGALVGAFFFGGLWETVRRAVSSTKPALWLLGSIFLRTGVTLAGFYFVSRAHWERLPACLLGFVLVHVFVMLRTRALMRRPARLAHEVTDAS